jgi:hypothetical protein
MPFMAKLIFAAAVWPIGSRQTGLRVIMLAYRLALAGTGTSEIGKTELWDKERVLIPASRKRNEYQREWRKRQLQRRARGSTTT